MEKQTKFCSRCGAKLRENAKYCGRCGTSIHGFEDSERVKNPKIDANNVNGIFEKEGIMDKRKVVFAGVFIAILFIFLFKMANGIGGDVEEKLVGTWVDNENDAIELVFYKDGSYRHGNNSVKVNGDYKCVSENEIELTSEQVGLGYDLWHIAGIHEFKLNGKKLYIENVGSFTKQ